MWFLVYLGKIGGNGRDVDGVISGGRRESYELRGLT